MTNEQMQVAFRHAKTTDFVKAFTLYNGKAVSFNGSVSGHPTFMKEIQVAFDNILGIFAPNELVHDYSFRDAPDYLKDRMYAFVIGCATRAAKPWADSARKLRLTDIHGTTVQFRTLFDQYIAYLDSRFDATGMNKQGERQLQAEVLKVVYKDGNRNVPYDTRIETFADALFAAIRVYADCKGVTVAEAYQEQIIHDHVIEQIPLFMQQHVSLLVQPDDVEQAIMSILPELRIQYNFAKNKGQPLTDSEMGNSKAAGRNGHETSKQYFNNKKTGNSARIERITKKGGKAQHLNVDLSKCNLQRGKCWKCGSPEHQLPECTQAQAEHRENTKNSKNFSDNNRKLVNAWKNENCDQDSAHEKGHGNSAMCRHCSGPRHDGKSCKDARDAANALQVSQVRAAIKAGIKGQFASFKADLELSKSANAVTGAEAAADDGEVCHTINPYDVLNGADE